MLIDTSGWFCIMDARDERHATAIQYYRAARRRITHSYVIAELTALSEARRISRKSNLLFTNEILTDQTVELVWVDELTSMKAWQLLQSRADKTLSLCDAVSFVLMTRERETEALTTDHHFEQAGFVKLLES